MLAAGDVHHHNSRAALSQLCEIYWLPLYAYARRRVSDVDEAGDLTQAFFVELLENKFVDAADVERGRFRAFLVTAFKHFLSKQWERRRAQKRGGGRTVLSLDFETAESSLQFEPTSQLTAEQLFDQQWAVTLLNHVMERLQAEFAKRKKQKMFVVLRDFIAGDHPGLTYAMAAAQLGMTEVATKKAASRMRQRYRELLRAEIARTVNGPEQVEDEIRNLFAVLSL